MIEKLKLTRRHARQIVPTLMAVLTIGFISYLGAHYHNLSQAVTPGAIYVTSASRTVAPNDTVSITVREDSGTSPVNSAQFLLKYNAAQLQYVSKVESGEFNFEGPTSTTDPSIIRIQRGMQGSTLTGDHAIVTLNFKVLASFGTVAVSIDKADSLLVANGQDILQTVRGGTYAVVAPAGTVVKDAVLSMAPAVGSYAKDAALSVVVRLNNPTQKVFSVAPAIIYPADKLAYISTTSSAAFPLATRTSNPAGTVDLVRTVAQGRAGFTGNDVVATVNFRVIGTSGSIPLSFKNTSGVFDANGQNILGSSTGSTYSITSGNAVSAPASARQASGSILPSDVLGAASGSTAPDTSTAKDAALYRPALTYTPAPGGGAAVNGSSTQIKGAVRLAPVTNARLLASNPGDAVIKVEYYLGKNIIATKTAPPYAYDLDTKPYKNGAYDIMIKTSYKSGPVDTGKDEIIVKNTVDPAYAMAHYGTNFFGSIAALAVVGLIAFKYLMPRFPRKATQPAVDSGYEGEFGAVEFAADHEAPIPSVITPDNGPTDTAVLTVEQTAAAQSTEAISTPAVQPFAPAPPSGVPAAAPQQAAVRPNPTATPPSS